MFCSFVVVEILNDVFLHGLMMNAEFENTYDCTALIDLEVKVQRLNLFVCGAKYRKDKLLKSYASKVLRFRNE